MQRLMRRLDIADYDIPSPIADTNIKPDKVKILLSQSIGAPSQPVVKVGDKVNVGDLIAKPCDNALSIALHSSINGKVTDITDKHIVISSK
jgi:Na+-translocating ferredoxin:NAD+ oxidoreductase RnfC subunit